MKVKTVLYVTTQIIGTSRYFSWAAYPSIWYARLQKKILDRINSFDNVDSYVKFYPNDVEVNPNKNIVKNGLLKTKILEENLIDILKERTFDLIVTEACATTLLETLCTKSQILCFFQKNYLKIYQDSVDILKKRIHLAESDEDYVELLSGFLEKGFGVNKKELNDEFLFKFGLGSVTKSPILLAKESLNKIIK